MAGYSSLTSSSLRDIERSSACQPQHTTSISMWKVSIQVPVFFFFFSCERSMLPQQLVLFCHADLWHCDSYSEIIACCHFPCLASSFYSAKKPAAQPPKAKDAANRNLWISGLGPKVRAAELKAKCGMYGTVSWPLATEDSMFHYCGIVCTFFC